MSENVTPQDLLENFCDHWNRYAFYPKLHPVHYVPETFAHDVAKAQLEGVDSAMVLPEDVQDAQQVRDWLSGFRVDKKGDISIVPLQVAAVDRRGRMAVLDLDISVNGKGHVDLFSHLNVFTMLSGYSRRKTWIDPKMLKRYDEFLAGGRTESLHAQSEEEITRFHKGMKALITAKLKDVAAREARRDRHAEETERLKDLQVDLHAEGVPVARLLKERRLQAGVEQGPGVMTFKSQGLSCELTTESTPEQRMAFAALLKAVAGE